MQVRLPEFGEVNKGGIPPWMRGARFGMDMLGSGQDFITKALQQQKMQQEMPFIQKLKEQKLQEAILANKINEAKSRYADPMAQAELKTQQQHNQFDPRMWEAAMQSQQANTNKTNMMTPLEAEKLRQQNRYYPEMTKSQIELNRMGGRGGLGAGDKSDLNFQRTIGIDNSHLRPDQLPEAANVVKSGGNSLSDGTPINVTPNITDALNRVARYGTTTALTNQGVQANQAESELPIYKKVIDEGINLYGDTINGFSPKLLQDMLDVKNHSAQQRIGKYMAAQQIAYDRAALMLKINALPAGVTLADEIRKLSYAEANNRFYRSSAESKKIASDIVSDTLEKGMNQRRSVDTGAASVYYKNRKGSSGESNKKYDFSKMSDAELEAMAGG